MRRPAFRPAAASTSHTPAGHASLCMLSTNTTAAALGPISPHWTSTRPESSAAVNRKNGIAPFGSLVEQVMTRLPYDEARRVFWIVDNCSAHRGAKAVERWQSRYPRLVLVHAPIHASWLNQIEIYFSIVQRKVLSPNDFPTLEA